MIAIIGLGNPDSNYKETRHNIGWQCVDFIHSAWSFVAFTKDKKFKSVIAKGTVNGVSVMLVKPQTYMNNSGQAVQAIAAYYDIPPENVWIIHDELDLPFGSFKVQKKLGAAGHNGIASIVEQLGTNAFMRWRIGISPSADKRPENYHAFVLKKFSFFERRRRAHLFEDIQTSLEEYLKKTSS